jgi:outer membrane immunogenic protein
MKRLLLASATLLAPTGAEIAVAADVPPEVIYPAGYPVGAPLVPPVAGPRFTFTGFYVGGTIGGALGSSQYAETPSGTFATVVSAAVPNIAAVGTSSTAPRGVIGGIEVGYNWQLGNLVLGFETDFSGWDMSSSSGVVGSGNPSRFLPNICPQSIPPAPPLPPCPGTTFRSTASMSSDWLFTARPRIGFANGNQLLYATGGLAVSNVNFAQSIILSDYPIATGGSGTAPTLAGASSLTLTGWTAGFGIEYALSWNWLIKAEYLYVSFPHQSTAQTISGAPASTGTVSDKLSASIARAGFNYRF